MSAFLTACFYAARSTMEMSTAPALHNFDLIAFDLDGTLAESKSPLDPAMAELLVELLRHKKVAVASGASYRQFEKQFLAPLGAAAELRNLYLLPTNGAALYRYADGWQTVYDTSLSESDAARVHGAFEKTFLEAGFVPEEVHGVLVENRGPQITFSGNGSTAPFEVKSRWDPDHKKREHLARILKTHLPDFSIAIAGTSSIDVTQAGMDKAYGLQKLADHLGITVETIFYVGDALFPGGNDAVVLSLGISHRQIENVDETKELIAGYLARKKSDSI